jgi:hypothetical protein
MSPNFVAYIILAVAATTGTVLSCRRTARDYGSRAAAKELAVAVPSLAAYLAICPWLGYGLPAQFLGGLASGVILAIGHRWIPSLTEYISDRRAR